MNKENCHTVPCVKVFRLPIVRFSVSCRPNRFTLGYNLRVSLITCSRYFMSWRSRNVASRVESPNICFNSATAFSCTHNSEHQQYQWWTCNTAVLCWWTHQLGSERQCNGCGYKLTYCTLSGVTAVINILQRIKTAVHCIWWIFVLFTCCS